MLKLNLRVKQDVFIGNNVQIIVTNIDSQNRTVELGFIAPKEIKILRGTLLRRGFPPSENKNAQEEQKPDAQS
ncbi:MAG: hypothetical protein KatS3mg087_0075 [Patescibacteria group bacterium]|nr:MAG: hypothetical protein KatS3mg087_0075 [Patescibacteria group bacterium]